MPFTLFHPALILPFRRLPRRWVSLTGLVAGSMAPDFEKFGKMHSSNIYSHTWPSLFYFTLPVGLALSFVFHGLVRNPLFQNLPPAWRARLARFRHFNWPRHCRTHIPAVLCSLLLGGATHLAWDVGTHWHSPVVRWLPWLDASLAQAGRFNLPGFAVVNALTSALGVAALLRAGQRLPAAGPAAPAPGLPAYWQRVALGTLLLAALRLAFRSTWHDGWDVLVTGFSAFTLSLVLVSVAHRLQQSVSHRP